MVKRRVLRICVLLFACLTAAAASGQEQPTEKLKLTKIRGDLYAVEGNGGNVIVYVTSEGVVLVDDGLFDEALRSELMTKIKSLSDKPVKYVFITHYHQDHLGANEQLLKMGAQIISTENTRNYILGNPWKRVEVYDNAGNFLRAQPYFPAERGIPTPPSVVFTDEMKIFLGGKEIRARFLGTAHTGGDAFIFFPAERVLHVGDNMKPLDGPLIDYNAGGSIVESIATLDALLQMNGSREIENLDDFDIVIPGHGTISDRAGLRAHRDRLVGLRDRVVNMKRSGKSYEEIAGVMATEYNWKPEDRNLGQWTFPGMMKELK